MAWGSAPDPVATKALARALACELGAKGRAKRHGVLGRPLCLYRISLPREDFAFTVDVSEGVCVLTGKHRRQATLPSTFAVALQRPLYGNTMLVPELSDAVGCSVYVPPEGTWPSAARLLLQRDVLERARMVQWDGITEMSLYNLYVDAVIVADEVALAARQVLAVQELLACVYVCAAAERSVAADG